jgi:DNA-binding protein HU-beta
MTKAELIKTISDQTGIPQTKTSEVFKALVAVIHSQEKLVIQGLGTFNHVHKPAHTARNPKTGESIEVPAKTHLKFKASKC